MKEFKLVDSDYSEKFITSLHDYYLKRITFYETKNKDLSKFSWTENKHVSLYVIKSYNDTFSYNEVNNNIFTSDYYLFFATVNETKNQLFYIDLYDETNNYTYAKLYSEPQYLSWIMSEKHIHVDVNKIINSSILSKFGRFYDDASIDSFTSSLSKQWVDKEYESTLKNLSEPTVITSFPETNKQFFIDRYHFDKMLNTINSSQFTDEFNQCLYAYEHEKWFLCAAGLGSCLEHLMFLVLKNYNDKGYKTLKGLLKNPTAHNYIIQFRQPPISISSRQETFFNILFMVRNAVDHHNTGKTQKELCDLLLDGISDLYNDYYSSSILVEKNTDND